MSQVPSTDLFERVFSSAPTGMALLDMNGVVVHANAMLCEITGYTGEELRSRSLFALAVDPEDLGNETSQIPELTAGRMMAYHVERQYRHAQGHRIWVQISISLVRETNDAPVQLVAQVQDISARKELEGHLEYLVDHDALTGLYNARHFERALARGTRIAARYGGGGAVILFDLDRFKSVNDQFGHNAGDDLLRTVSATLRARLRETDVLARLGGDEFAILLPRASAQEAEASADGLVKALRLLTATLGDRQIPVTASVGVAMFGGLTDREIMAAADLAMYEAKETGRDRFVLYRPRPETPRTSTRTSEAERVRRAVTHHQFELHCQPVVDLATESIEHFELLLRLRTDDGQLLTPSTFLHVAERFGAIATIDSWVLSRACGLLADEPFKDQTTKVSINIAPRSMADPELLLTLDRKIAKSQFDPSRLVFELTETAAIGSLEQAKAFLTAVHKRGCEVALDDFGGSFGSYRHLKRLPFNYFKIGGEVVRGCSANTSDRLIVEAMVAIARGVGTKTVAKSVTDAETRDCLRQSGIDYAQGFHIGSPLPLSEATALYFGKGTGSMNGSSTKRTTQRRTPLAGSALAFQRTGSKTSARR
ncbi:MAG: EAL domain-containing protein [Acidobacteria bacterium]|nr:EAL domain-containing protein [Acidobacteriota bacterium]